MQCRALSCILCLVVTFYWIQANIPETTGFCLSLTSILNVISIFTIIFYYYLKKEDPSFDKGKYFTGLSWSYFGMQISLLVLLIVMVLVGTC